MKIKKKMNTDFKISNNLITRFNKRYQKRPEHWVINDLKDYLNVILSSGQIRKLNKYSNRNTPVAVNIGLGNSYNMVMMNNKLITITCK